MAAAEELGWRTAHSDAASELGVACRWAGDYYDECWVL